MLHRTNRLTCLYRARFVFNSGHRCGNEAASDQLAIGLKERARGQRELSPMSGLRESPQITFEERSDGRPHPAAIITRVELSAMKYSWVAFMRARLCARAYIILLPSGRCIMRVPGT